jgi:hypothetical protein
MQQLYILQALMSLTVLREIERKGWTSILRSRDDLDPQKLARGEDGDECSNSNDCSA